ncbi:DUF2939 domain-containing protein [Candidatus Pelagibacter sp.]|nr:DUF2939 domain-containing protein [Candidatus Pelagibacter sp.]
MLNKIKKFLILILISIFLYAFTAMYSLHQLHKGVYYNDKRLIENYIEWQSVRKNLKNFINAEILNKTQAKDSLSGLEDVEILLSGFAGKFIEIAIDTYLNSDGVSLLLEKTKKKDEIPKPSIITLLGCFIIMENNGINSFYVNYEIEGKQYPIYFVRDGVKWKITNVEFPKKLFDKIK